MLHSDVLGEYVLFFFALAVLPHDAFFIPDPPQPLLMTLSMVSHNLHARIVGLSYPYFFCFPSPFTIFSS
ncbi:hypothetical protein GGI35DRAFT_433550 [Trichoderma velutinum]